MKISEARKLAKELRDHHNLDGWRVKFRTKMVNGKSVIATTFFDDKEFHFSIPNFSLNSEEFCKDQILHEIAHVLAGWEAQHGDEWKKKCVEIGALPFLICEKEYTITGIDAIFGRWGD